MRTAALLTVALVATAAQDILNSNPRILAKTPPAPPSPPTPAKAIPTSYAENVTLAYKASLGCGACIRGGYIYCVPGAAGSDESSWGNKTATCCKDEATCTQAKDSTYTCSNAFSDPVLAKNICPFRP